MPLVSGVVVVAASVEVDDSECARPNQLTRNAAARPILVFRCTKFFPSSVLLPGCEFVMSLPNIFQSRFRTTQCYRQDALLALLITKVLDRGE